MSDLLERLRDLLVQATTEKSHFYVAKCVRDSINEIERLRGINEAAYQTCNELRETNVRLRAALESVLSHAGDEIPVALRREVGEALREGEDE